MPHAAQSKMEFGSELARQRAARRRETLEFIQSMLGQLRDMAEGERYDMLSYLVEMAYLEASDIMRGQRPARIGGRIVG